MAGLDQLPEKQQRAWLVSCVEEPALKLVEALYARTSTLNELLVEIGKVFPNYATDFSLREQVARVAVLGASPKMHELEEMLLLLEDLWESMTPNAVSDQERIVKVVDKLHATTWQGIRDSPVWRNYLTA